MVFAASILTGAAAPANTTTATTRISKPRSSSGATVNFRPRKSCNKKRTSTVVTSASVPTSQQTAVVSPSPRDPSCPADWWKDAIVYQVR